MAAGTFAIPANVEVEVGGNVEATAKISVTGGKLTVNGEVKTGATITAVNPTQLVLKGAVNEAITYTAEYTTTDAVKEAFNGKTGVYVLTGANYTALLGEEASFVAAGGAKAVRVFPYATTAENQQVIMSIDNGTAFEETETIVTAGMHYFAVNIEHPDTTNKNVTGTMHEGTPLTDGVHTWEITVGGVKVASGSFTVTAEA